ncbi:MAG: aldo/keto reductase [Candidatus Neomarinimicrobiota bacterium]|nr:MAG: aldo/keto reductase [Candidatus Neomarinimicrobiota bacterium]
MEYRRLGSSGLKVSALSFGAWVTFGQQIGEEVAAECMEAAYDAGVNFFDNAEVYAQGEAEIIMGRILKAKGWGRDTYAVSSKVFFGGRLPTQRGLHRKHIRDACDAALRRLQVDYLDLFFCHRPDADTPIEETVLAMNQLIQQGKILYWGTSEWSAAQIMTAEAVAREYHVQGPTMEQPEYNLFHREKVEGEFLPLYEEIGLGLTTWSPLASGLLTGKYLEGDPGNTRIHLKNYEWLKQRFESEEGQSMLEKVRRLRPLADNLGMTLAQFSLAWCASNPHVSTVITGASRPEQVRENMQAIDLVDRLTPEVLAAVEDIVRNKPAEPPRF